MDLEIPIFLFQAVFSIIFYEHFYSSLFFDIFYIPPIIELNCQGGDKIEVRDLVLP